LASISKLYFGFTEELGRCLEKSKFDYEERSWRRTADSSG
jgi:hypothetical protein